MAVEVGVGHTLYTPLGKSLKSDEIIIRQQYILANNQVLPAASDSGTRTCEAAV